MKIELNGETYETRARDLAELCVEEGFGDMRVATALNGAFVPAALRDTQFLKEGDKVEILAPRQGG